MKKISQKILALLVGIAFGYMIGSLAWAGDEVPMVWCENPDTGEVSKWLGVCPEGYPRKK
tara:strand:- start:1014 stop:1193 length:180 start_codon:yes stop_codon:yes gene_type:complete